jgi:nitrogen-specific signal transduction histidine kinase
MMILSQIKEYKRLKEVKLDYIKKQQQVIKLMNRSAKAKASVDQNGVNFRIEDRIKYYDLKIQEIKSKSLLLRLYAMFV